MKPRPCGRDRFEGLTTRSDPYRISCHSSIVKVQRQARVHAPAQSPNDGPFGRSCQTTRTPCRPVGRPALSPSGRRAEAECYRCPRGVSNSLLRPAHDGRGAGPKPGGGTALEVRSDWSRRAG